MIAGRAWADIVEEEEAQMGAELQPSYSLEFEASMGSGIYSSGSLGSEVDEAALFGENGPSTNIDVEPTVPPFDTTQKKENAKANESIVVTTTTTTDVVDQNQDVIKTTQTKEANNGFVKDIVKKWHEQSRPKKVVTIVRPSKDQGHYKGQMQDSLKKGGREFNNNNSTGVKKEFDEDDQVVVTYINNFKKQGLKRTTSLATSGSPRASSPSRVLSRASSFEQQAPSESSESTLATITSSNSQKTNKYIPPHLRKTLSDSVDSETIATASALYSAHSSPSLQNQQYGMATINYATDFQDKIASYSWRPGNYQTKYRDIANAGTVWDAAMNQATDIVRRGTTWDEALRPLRRRLPHRRFTHLVIHDYLQQRLPEKSMSCPEDRVLLEWQRQATPRGDELDPAPTDPRTAAIPYYPFSSTYQIVPASWVKDMRDGVGTTVDQWQKSKKKQR
eukprot:TRINITY_DN453_c1_g2_i4.p1 TRINITY_DN453_c1_g2~~TRINITY_DN453_c1_g2_i4.p1  ORF type:complete len:504 (-),score=40.25 TRINITY_DN453_c1_g2_i4:1-1347(-)